MYLFSLYQVIFASDLFVYFTDTLCKKYMLSWLLRADSVDSTDNVKADELPVVSADSLDVSACCSDGICSICYLGKCVRLLSTCCVCHLSWHSSKSLLGWWLPTLSADSADVWVKVWRADGYYLLYLLYLAADLMVTYFVSYLGWCVSLMSLWSPDFSAISADVWAWWAVGYLLCLIAQLMCEPADGYLFCLLPRW